MSGESDKRTVRVRIAGRVQGVGFRYWTEEMVVALGLTGWVRNRRGGQVEALLIGPADSVEAVIAACRHGPPAARVEAVDRTAAADDGSVGFRQVPTV